MKYFSILLLVIYFNLLSCKNKPTPKPTTAPATIVDVLIAKPQTIPNIIEANGTVVAKEYVELHPEVSGRITYLNVHEGSTVPKNTIIARINDADLQAQLNKVKVQLNLAIITEQRLKKLLNFQGVNQSDYDVALNQVKSYKADISVLRAQIDKTVVRAPFTGIMGLRQVSPGAYVTSQNIIATLQQLDRVKIDFTIPDNYAYYISKGKSIFVEIDADKVTRRKASIIATEPQINANTRNLKIRAILDGGNINPGSFVKVYVDAGISSGILVPANAIIPDAKAKKLVVIKDGKAKFVNIETGVRQAGAVQVTKGINTGDSIVITGALFARPNTPVKIRSIKKLEDI